MLRALVTKAKETPAGFLALTLHAHLPAVCDPPLAPGPHGLEWLLEAAAETYLPLLRVLTNLERDGVPAHFNINLSPILLEQLAHPTFIAEFPRYITRKIVAAREDEAYFIQSGDADLAETARFWHRFFTTALDDFNALGGKIIDGFRRFNDAGMIEVLTSGATHGYMPLLGTDESVRAQVRTAVETHVRHLGRAPRGIWAPECGYRPAGLWSYPVQFANGGGADEPHPGFERIGVEQALSESGLDYFFVDTHLIEEAERVVPPEEEGEEVSNGLHRRLYQPYYVDGPGGRDSAATVFARDPRTGLQVWSSDMGYPADFNYLDFHKKRFPGGHRYWKVTGRNVDIADKQPYRPEQAAERIQSHASHFVQLVYEALQPGFNDGGFRVPPILSAPFDAELFGHWWFEGPQWLEAVCRTLHEHNTRIATITCSLYLDQYPRAGFIAMREGSWGAGGNNQVWMNPETSWTYTHIYPAELYTREVASQAKWRDSPLGLRIVQQLCRELLLLESSDWQTLITTGAARDYAEMRFLTHNDQFLELKTIWQAFEADGALNRAHGQPPRRDRAPRLISSPTSTPALWAAGSRSRGPRL